MAKTLPAKDFAEIWRGAAGSGMNGVHSSGVLFLFFFLRSLLMRIRVLTFNINGLRPACAAFGGIRVILESLNADVVCFQEHKMRREDLDCSLSVLDGWRVMKTSGGLCMAVSYSHAHRRESFFTFNRTGNKGYAGVATFVKCSTVGVPIHAEEGITGILALDRSIPRTRAPELLGEPWMGYPAALLEKLDAEGRCLITDHDYFVLFNV